MSADATRNATTPEHTPVTLLGLGEMGTALALTLTELGHRTTVWNRTAAKAEPLEAKGAAHATSPAAAVMASPLVVVCLLDHSAAQEVLDAAGEAVAGRTVVNLTSQTPDQARSLAAWTADHDASYLGGGIMAGSEQIGTADAHLYYSGSSAAFEAHRVTLEQLGATRFFGDDPGLAPLHHVAVTALGFELWASYLNTAALFAAEGVDAQSFTPLAVEILDDMVAVLPALGTAVDTGAYPPDAGTVRVQAALMGDMIDTREARGVDAELLRRVQTLMTRRVASGHGDDGFSGLIEEIRHHAVAGGS